MFFGIIRRLATTPTSDPAQLREQRTKELETAAQAFEALHQHDDVAAEVARHQTAYGDLMNKLITGELGKKADYEAYRKQLADTHDRFVVPRLAPAATAPDALSEEQRIAAQLRTVVTAARLAVTKLGVLDPHIDSLEKDAEADAVAAESLGAVPSIPRTLPEMETRYSEYLTQMLQGFRALLLKKPGDAVHGADLATLTAAFTNPATLIDATALSEIQQRLSKVSAATTRSLPVTSQAALGQARLAATGLVALLPVITNARQAEIDRQVAEAAAAALSTVASGPLAPATTFEQLQAAHTLHTGTVARAFQLLVTNEPAGATRVRYQGQFDQYLDRLNNDGLLSPTEINDTRTVLEGIRAAGSFTTLPLPIRQTLEAALVSLTELEGIETRYDLSRQERNKQMAADAASAALAAVSAAPITPLSTLEQLRTAHEQHAGVVANAFRLLATNEPLGSTARTGYETELRQYMERLSDGVLTDAELGATQVELNGIRIAPAFTALPAVVRTAIDNAIASLAMLRTFEHRYETRLQEQRDKEAQDAAAALLTAATGPVFVPAATLPEARNQRRDQLAEVSQAARSLLTLSPGDAAIQALFTTCLNYASGSVPLTVGDVATLRGELLARRASATLVPLQQALDRAIVATNSLTVLLPHMTQLEAADAAAAAASRFTGMGTTPVVPLTTLDQARDAHHRLAGGVARTFQLLAANEPATSPDRTFYNAMANICIVAINGNTSLTAGDLTAMDGRLIALHASGAFAALPLPLQQAIDQSLLALSELRSVTLAYTQRLTETRNKEQADANAALLATVPTLVVANAMPTEEMEKNYAAHMQGAMQAFTVLQRIDPLNAFGTLRTGQQHFNIFQPATVPPAVLNLADLSNAINDINIVRTDPSFATVAPADRRDIDAAVTALESLRVILPLLPARRAPGPNALFNNEDYRNARAEIETAHRTFLARIADPGVTAAELRAMHDTEHRRLSSSFAVLRGQNAVGMNAGYCDDQMNRISRRFARNRLVTATQANDYVTILSNARANANVPRAMTQPGLLALDQALFSAQNIQALLPVIEQRQKQEAAGNSTYVTARTAFVAEQMQQMTKGSRDTNSLHQQHDRLLDTVQTAYATLLAQPAAIAARAHFDRNAFLRRQRDIAHVRNSHGFAGERLIHAIHHDFEHLMEHLLHHPEPALATAMQSINQALGSAEVLLQLEHVHHAAHQAHDGTGPEWWKRGITDGLRPPLHLWTDHGPVSAGERALATVAWPFRFATRLLYKGAVQMVVGGGSKNNPLTWPTRSLQFSVKYTAEAVKKYKGTAAIGATAGTFFGGFPVGTVIGALAAPIVRRMYNENGTGGGGGGGHDAHGHGGH